MKAELIDFNKPAEYVTTELCKIVSGNLNRLALAVLIAFGCYAVMGLVLWYLNKKQPDKKKLIKYVYIITDWLGTFTMFAGVVVAGYAIQLT